MDVVEAVVEVEVDGRDNMELGMEDIDENIEDIVDFSHKVVANLVAKIGFWVEMEKVYKEGLCPNYSDMEYPKFETSAE